MLANIALHELEQAASRSYQDKGGTPFLIRYADDFVVLHPSLEGIEASKTAIEHWLGGMGLHLSPTKTRVSHTVRPHEGNVGFDFLGFTIRQYPRGRCHTGKATNGKPLGFKTYITPSKEAIKRHTTEIGTFIRQHRAVSQENLIGTLNPKIRGWANYYRAAASAGAFQHCDTQLFALLLRWGRRRHQNKSVRWIVARYWHPRQGRTWTFAPTAGPALRYHTHTRQRRHVKVRGTASPFDGNLVYWARRLRHHPLTKTTLGWLLQRQGGACARCGLLFNDEDCIEIDHTCPTVLGGTPNSANMQALHRHCHDKKTAHDGSIQRRVVGTHDKTP